jgi:hypothetical protein
MSAMPMNQAPVAAAAIIELLEHQRTLYRRLRVLADRQRTLVFSEDHQPLMDLLAERQRLVDGLVSLTAKMAPYRERWTQLYQVMDESSRRIITRLLEEVNTALAGILKSDSHDTATLKAQRDQTSHQISNLNSGKLVGAAYASSGVSARAVYSDAEA